MKYVNVLKHVSNGKPTKNYYCKISLPGMKPVFRSTGTGVRTKAEAFASKLLNELSANYDDPKAKTIPLSKALERFHASRGHDQKLHAHKRRLQGVVTNRADLKDKAVFGFDPNLPFHKLQTSDVHELVTNRIAEGYALTSVLSELSFLSSAIEFIDTAGKAVPKIDFKKIKKANQIVQKSSKLRYLTRDEAKRLLHELHPDTPVNNTKHEADSDDYAERQDLFDFVSLLLLTGARYSEIAQLKWNQVDLQSRTLNLYRSKVANESNFIMNNTMFAILARRANSTSEWVFTNKAKNGPRNYTNKGFNSAVKRAGLKDVTQHTLRKTTASWLVQANIPIQQVAQVLGHSSPAITASTYAFLAPNQAFEASSTIIDIAGTNY